MAVIRARLLMVLAASVFGVWAAGCKPAALPPEQPPVTRPEKPSAEPVPAPKTPPQPPVQPSTQVAPNPKPAAAAVPDAAPEPWVTLQSECADFAFDPEAGALAGLDGKANTLTLYPRSYLEGESPDVVGPVKTSEGVGSVVHKCCGDGSYFVVVHRDGRQMGVLDVKTLKTVELIPLLNPSVASAAGALNRDDPYVYYVAKTPSGLQAARVRVDTFKDEGTTGVPASEVAVSADGKFLYTRGIAAPDIVRAYTWSTDKQSGKTKWERIREHRGWHARRFPDANGAYISAGALLHSADLQQTVARLEFEPMCFFRDRPVIAGLSGGEVVAASCNDFRAYGRASLPEGFLIDEPAATPIPPPGQLPSWTRPSRSSRSSRTSRTRASAPVRPRVFLFPDEPNGRVVVVRRDRAVLLSLKEMEVPDEPWLKLTVDAPKDVTVGQRLEIPFKPADERCSVSISDGPKGMKISGGKLVWTPDDSQVGPAGVELRVHYGEFGRVHTFQLHVSRPFIRLDFIPDGLQLDPAGKRAVAWTSGRRPRSTERERSRVALIDLEKRELVREKQLLYPINGAVPDDHFVYVAPAYAKRVYARSLDDLSSTGHVLSDFIPGRVGLVSSKLLFASRANPSRVAYYRVPELKPVGFEMVGKMAADARRDWRWSWISTIISRDGSHTPRYEQRPPTTHMPAGGVYTDGVLFTPDLARARMLVDVDGMPVFTLDHPRAPVHPRVWNREIRSGSIVTGTGERVGPGGGGRTGIMTDHPVAVSLTSSLANGRVSARLVLRELVSAKVVDRIPLVEGEKAPSDRLTAEIYAGSSGILAHRGGSIVAVLGKRLFLHTLDGELLKRYPRPFAFVTFSKVTTVDLLVPTKIEHRVTGGGGPLEFDLTMTRRGVTIDHKTGTVTIDGALLLKEAMAAAKKKFAKPLRVRDPKGNQRTLKPEERVAYLARVTRAPFIRLMEREPRGIPWLVPVGVIASDENGQVASLDYQVLLEVPEDMVLEAILGKPKKPDDGKTKPGEKPAVGI